MAQGIITTLAGTGLACSYGGDGGPAAAAGLCGVTNSAVDAAGNIYFGANQRIRRIGADGIITTIAGNGGTGISGDGGPALSASLGQVVNIAIQGSRLCFGDRDSRAVKIRCVDLNSGIILGWGLGNGGSGEGGNGGNISGASFVFPWGVAFDEAGNFYVSDYFANTVRRVDPTGIVTKLAGQGYGPLGDGGPALAANIYMPKDIYYRNGGLYIGDTGNSRIRRVDLATGMISTVAGNGTPWDAGSGADGGSALLAGFSPTGIVLDQAGNLFIGAGIELVRRVDTSGIITTIAGTPGLHGGGGNDDVPSTQTLFAAVGGLGWDPFANRLLISDNGTRLRQIFYTPPTTTALSLSANSVAPGGQVTLQATVSPVTATGSVRFYAGAALLGSVPLINSVASFTWTAPFGGLPTYGMRAVYGGDRNDNLSTSDTIVETILYPTATTTLTPSPNPSVYGGSVTLIATVSPAAATGTVQFYNGTNSLGSANLAGGQALLQVANLPVGSLSLQAIYGGDGTYPSSASAFVTQVVTKVPSSVTLTSSANPSTAGQPISLTATVSPSTATGTVQFFNGATLIGSASLASGQAQFSIATLPVGAASLTATYGGDAGYPGSTSGALLQNVTGTLTVTLYSTQNPTIPQQAITIMVSSTQNPGSGAPATGSVQLLDGSTVLATNPLLAGSTQFSVSFTALGSHPLTAVYSGDSSYVGSTSAVLNQAVKNLARGYITSSLTPSPVGSAVTFTTTIYQSAATGNVEFSDYGASGGGNPVTLGSAPVVNSTAAFTTSSLSPGLHNITGSYMGDADYVSFSTSLFAQVVKPATTSSVTAALPSAVYGQSVSFTASVSPAAATGTVQFFDGGTSLGSAALSNGTAVLAVSSLSVGAHSITAAYGGDSTYFSSTSAPWTETVTKAAITITVGSSSNPSLPSQVVNFTATVSPISATGTVQFFDGTTSLGSVAISSASAALAVSVLSVGDHSITAVYSGDAGYATGTSAILPQTISKALTTVTLTSAPNPSTLGGAVSIGATVAPGTVTGTVQFFDGAASLGSAVLTGGSASIAVSTLPVGTHSITAVFSGDALNAGSSSPTLSLTIGKASSGFGLSSSMNPSTAGQTIAFTAILSPSSATGTVQFLDGATPLGTVTISGGSAALSLSSLAAGTHSISAVYSGDGNYLGASGGTVMQTVKPAPGVVMTVSPNPAIEGQTVTLAAVLSPGAATGTVTFFEGLGAQLGTVPISGGLATLALTPQIYAFPLGTHLIHAVYNSDATYGPSVSAVVTLTIVAKQATTLAITSSLNPSIAGQAVRFTAKVSPSAATGTVLFLDGTAPFATVAVSGGTASITISTLAADTHMIVAAYSGDVNYAPIANVMPQTVSPGAPRHLTAAAASASQINLSWLASPTSGVTYNVYSSATSGFTPGPSNRIASGVTATGYSNTGLPASTTRYYLVTAQSSVVESAPSNQAGATTVAPAGCHVSYTVTNQWNVGFGTAISVQNTGTAPVNGWNLTWTWAGNQQIGQAWNSNYSQTGANAKLTNASWNPTIAAGATLNGMGFNGTYSGSNPAPAAFYLNGTLCN